MKRISELLVCALLVASVPGQAQFSFEDIFGPNTGTQKPKEKAKPSTKPKPAPSKPEKKADQGESSSKNAEQEKYEAMKKIPRPSESFKDAGRLTPEEQKGLELSLNWAIESYSAGKGLANDAAEALALAKKDYVQKLALSEAAAKEAQAANQKASNAEAKLSSAKARNQKALSEQKRLAAEKETSAVNLAVASTLKVTAEVSLSGVKAVVPQKPELPEIPALPVAPKEEVPLPVKKADAMAQAAAEAALPEDQKAALAEQRRLEEEAKEAQRATAAAELKAATENRNAVIAERKRLEDAYAKEMASFNARVKSAENDLKKAQAEEAKADAKLKELTKALAAADAEVSASAVALVAAEASLVEAKELASKKVSDSKAAMKVTQDADDVLQKKTKNSKWANSIRDVAYDNLEYIRDLVREVNRQNAHLFADKAVNLALETEGARAEAHYKKKNLDSALWSKSKADKELAEKQKNHDFSVQKLNGLNSDFQVAVNDLEKKTAALRTAEVALKQADSEYAAAYAQFKQQEAQWKKSNDTFVQAKTAREALAAKVKAQLESAKWYGQKALTLKKEIEKLEAEQEVLKKQKAELEPKVAADAKLKPKMTELDTKIASNDKKIAEKKLAVVKEEQDQVKWTALHEASSKELEALIAKEKAAADTAASFKAIMDQGKSQGDAKLKVQKAAKAVADSSKAARDGSLSKKSGIESKIAKTQQELTWNGQALAKAKSNLEKADKELELAQMRNSKAQDRYSAAKASEASNMEIAKKEEGRYELRSEQEKKHTEEMELYYKASVWPRSKVNDYWTDLVIAEIKMNFSSFHAAKDVENYCPGYRKASRQYQTVCWLRIVGGMVKHESNFKTSTTFFEVDFGLDSVGLFAMSRGECKFAPTEQLLANPVLNLSCGMRYMARLIKKDQCIANEVWKGCGAAKYWAVLNLPRKVGKYNMGHQPQIKAIAAKYKDF